MIENKLVSQYLNDENQLYQDWYSALNHDDTSLRKITKRPSLNEIKEMARVWLQKLIDRNSPALRKLFCEAQLPSLLGADTACTRWKKIRQHHNFHELQELIVAITVDLTLAPFIHPSHTAIAVTILVTGHFLDKLCLSC